MFCPPLNVWEKGVGGMRGQTHARERDARAPGANLRCARLRRVPPQRRSSPAGASTPSGRASARTLSRFRHQDAQTPPSPRVGKGGWGDEGANVHGNTAHHASCPRTLPLRGDARAPRRRRLRSFSRFGLQDAQPPPSPRVGEGGWGDEGANAHKNPENHSSNSTLERQGESR